MEVNRTVTAVSRPTRATLWLEQIWGSDPHTCDRGAETQARSASPRSAVLVLLYSSPFSSTIYVCFLTRVLVWCLRQSLECDSKQFWIQTSVEALEGRGICSYSLSNAESLEVPCGFWGTAVCQTLRRDLWEDIFRADCLRLVGSEAGWGVYEEGQWSGDRLGWCHSEVSVFLLLGRCLPAWCFCSPGDKGMAVIGAGLPDALHGCTVLLSFLIDCRDLITKVGRSWQGAEDAFGCFLLLLLLFLLCSLFSSALPSVPLFSSAFP